MTVKSGYPLIAHQSLDAVVAYRNGRKITAKEFINDAYKIAATLPNKQHVLNTCQDRYHFAVGFAATLLAECISLMPSSLTAETLKTLAVLAPGFTTLEDRKITTLCGSTSNTLQDIPMIKGDQLAAWVFTSGSTGTPLPHAKTWGSLVKNVRVEAARLGLLDGRAHSIIGTVPPQHMYGFESTVLVALQSGAAFDAAHPFYPADICSAIAALPQPRLLVTTPYHLNSLLSSGIQMAAIDLVVSATAPLSKELAREAENSLQAPLLEIYGCTETGQLATRRPTETEEWQLFNHINLAKDGDKIIASGGHIEQPVTLSDRIEITREGCFLLHGRADDMINIAGKRSSFAYLNHQLTTLPGVEDGTFFMPSDVTEGKITRLTAFVVAPHLTAPTLIKTLRERIDPVFLPRPLIFVDALPRTKTGKLPHAALINLAKANRLQ